MKKLALSAAAVMALSFNHIASADQGGFSDSSKAEGFQGPNTTVSVADALKLKDDEPVILEGNITKRLSHEKYEFTDGKNTITVEIDDDDWKGTHVTPKDKVRLEGEVDTHRDGSIDIDVDRVELLK